MRIVLTDETIKVSSMMQQKISTMQSSKLTDSDSAKNFRFLGQRIPFRESEQKILGSLFYAGDLGFAGMLHIRLVGSPYAHARIVSINLDQARRVSGVVAVFRAEDLPTRDQVINSRTSAILTSAVEDAVGVRISELPISSQTLWEAMR